jgi:hypothetical protein
MTTPVGAKGSEIAGEKPARARDRGIRRWRDWQASALSGWMAYVRAGAPRRAAWFTIIAVCGCNEAAEPRPSAVATARQRITAPPVPTGSTAVPAASTVFVARTGSDSTGDGSEALPFATIAHAVSVVNAKPEGPAWSVVIRGGTYREGEITVTRSNVRVQRYAAEHVLVLGSVLQTGFTGSGPYGKQVSGVATSRLEVDCADTFPGNPGAEDFGSRTAFSVSRAGLPLRRVATGTAPAPGQYAYDPSNDTLTVGDEPDSIEVASSLYAIRTRASNVAIVGLDVRGYATCAVNWSKTVGADTFYKGSILFYKDTVADSDSFVRNCTIANNSGGGGQRPRRPDLGQRHREPRLGRRAGRQLRRPQRERQRDLVQQPAPLGHDDGRGHEAHAHPGRRGGRQPVRRKRGPGLLVRSGVRRERSVAAVRHHA